MADLEGLAQRIEIMSPPDQLRLAAELLEARRPEVAYAVAQKAVDKLGLIVRVAARVVCPKASNSVCIDWAACAAAGRCVR